MTVAELIAKLGSYPPGAGILLWDADNQCVEPASDVSDYDAPDFILIDY